MKLSTLTRLPLSAEQGWPEIERVHPRLVKLFAFIVLRALAHAARCEDPFRQFATAGLAILFGLQSAINMAVNIHLVPAKGMTLPFISYGGSSMISLAWGMGMLLALTRERPRTAALARHGELAPAASPA